MLVVHRNHRKVVSVLHHFHSISTLVTTLVCYSYDPISAISHVVENDAVFSMICDSERFWILEIDLQNVLDVVGQTRLLVVVNLSVLIRYCQLRNL